MNWQSAYERYPVNDHLIWLNNCGTVPAGRHIIESVNLYLEGYSEKGIYTKAGVYTEVQQKIKTILARMLNCKPEELALIHHTAEGMNFISHGIDLHPGDEVVLLENEYPSNYYPWHHWKDKGVIIKTAPMEHSPEAFFNKLREIISEKTRLVSLSAVHWCTGMPLPLESIGALCRKKNIDFVVDGAQGVGMQPMDVKKAGVSFMAFSAWKWLMGPLGLGVLYLPKENLERLKPIFIGTESVVQHEEYLPYKSTLKSTAARFTISTANFNDWIYFLSALEFLEAYGFQAVRERIFELSGRLTIGLKEIGYAVFSDHFPNRPTGIVVCEKPGIPTRRIMAHLKTNHIVAAERIGRVRFSPHIYLLPDQIDETIRVLARLHG